MSLPVDQLLISAIQACFDQRVASLLPKATALKMINRKPDRWAYLLFTSCAVNRHWHLNLAFICHLDATPSFHDRGWKLFLYNIYYINSHLLLNKSSHVVRFQMAVKIIHDCFCMHFVHSFKYFYLILIIYTLLFDFN